MPYHKTVDTIDYYRPKIHILDSDEVVKIENLSDEEVQENEPDRKILSVFRTATNRPYVIYQENNRQYRLNHAGDIYPGNCPGVVHLKMTCNRNTSVSCLFRTYLKSVITCDPNASEYFTPGNWKFLPRSKGEQYKYCGRLKTRQIVHTCPGRKVGGPRRQITTRSVSDFE